MSELVLGPLLRYVGPCFDHQVALLRLDGRTATLALDKTVAGEQQEPALQRSFERRLA